jgi:hypothetical protein
LNLSSAQNPGQIPTPEQYFGFRPGAEKMIIDYEQLTGYLNELGKTSPRVKMLEIGHSPMGKPMYVAFISSPGNIASLDTLREINKRLALDPNIPENERRALIENGRVFIMATLSMHSNEIGPSQSAPLIAYELATTQDPEKLKWLDNIVYMMVPNHNPDGMDMIANYYRKNKDTKYERSEMPGIYHKYVGHDNNRDFITLSQEDTKAIARVYNLDWFPQVFIEKHQMGFTGVRYFVPPFYDPIAQNIDATIWNWIGVFGSCMITDMTSDSLKGIAQSYIYDDYWPGSTETCIWKNIIGMLTESASTVYATSVYIEPNELRAGGKGLAEYKKSSNMPLPWPGGWWKLEDIVNYELSSTFSLIKTSSIYRNEILTLRNDLCRSEVKKGITEAPFYYQLPLEQHDQGELVDMVNLLKEHNISIYKIRDKIVKGDHTFNAGDIIIPLSQPFRPFIKEVMEKQQFPVRHFTPDGKVIKPSDITSWSLPLHRNVRAIEIDEKIEGMENQLEEITAKYTLNKMDKPGDFMVVVLPVNNNESYKAAFNALEKGLKVKRTDKDTTINNVKIGRGSFVIINDTGIDQVIDSLNIPPVFLNDTSNLKTLTVKIPRIALVESYFEDMDAGWTRFIFEKYHIPFRIVHPGDFEKTDFVSNFDVVIFPSESKSILMEGKYKTSDDVYEISEYPPEYTKGIGKTGMEKLMAFLNEGGIIISWGSSTELFTGTLEIRTGKDNKEEFALPFDDLSKQLKADGVFCPGALVKVNLLQDNPLTLGMQPEAGVFFDGTPAFATRLASFDMDRRVIAKFPETNILMSGYIEKEEKLSNKSVMIWLKKGKGQLVLYGFLPLFRASTQGSYKLLFNALMLPGIN